LQAKQTVITVMTQFDWSINQSIDWPRDCSFPRLECKGKLCCAKSETIKKGNDHEVGPVFTVLYIFYKWNIYLSVLFEWIQWPGGFHLPRMW